MNDEQKNLPQQFSSNFGAEEFIRFSCAGIAWQLIGVALGMVFKNVGITMFFIATFFGFLWFAPYWQPAYAIFSKIMGNQNIPPRLIRAEYRGWAFLAHYGVLGFKLFVLSLVFSIAVRLT